MGRHSAPDDQPDGGDIAVVENAGPPELDLRAGRHSAGGDDRVAGGDDRVALDEQPTQMIAAVPADAAEVDAAQDTHVTDELPPALDLAGPSDETQTAPSDKAARRAAERELRAQRKAEKKGARGESGTQADLRLLRQRPAVRAQCLAAVVASFGLYTLVMFVIGRTDRYLLWLWIPIVATGVLVGVVLDLAHRRERALRATQPAPEAASQQTSEQTSEPATEPPGSGRSV